MRKARILAVDDVPSNLIALESVLDRAFDLRFAESGTKAIAMLREDPDVDVILMDVQMPVMDGYQAAELIKAIPGCEDIPIAFITAVYREDPHVKRGFQVGGIDYFSKPFDPDLLRMKMAIYSAFRQKAAMLRERELHIRETEELLKASRKLSTVLESLPIGVLIADTDGRIIQTNDEVTRICRSNPTHEDELGTMLGWREPGGLALLDNASLARVLRSGQVSSNERIAITCHDGFQKTVVATISPLLSLDRNLDRHVVGAVVILKDTTESTQLEAELESRVTKLVALGVEVEQNLDSIQRASD